jgi:hypothetical protein
MDPGYRSPVIDFFRRGDTARDVRLLAAQGALSTAAHEQLALLVMLSDDADSQIAATAQATIESLPERALRAFLARADVPAEIRKFFADRGVTPAEVAAPEAADPLIEVPDEEDEQPAQAEAEGDQARRSEGGEDAEPKLLANLPIKKKIKLASKGTREQRAQLIRDPNKLVAAAVLSSPKLTDAEVESFAKMANVSEEVLRVIGMSRTWLKSYGVVLGLVKNPKTPPAISMQLLQRINERDIKMLMVDRNVPEALRLAARKFAVKGLK